MNSRIPETGKGIQHEILLLPIRSGMRYNLSMFHPIVLGLLLGIAFGFISQRGRF